MTVSLSLKGKVAIVTGSGQGIGRAVAMYLAEQGVKVVTNNRRRHSTGYAQLTERDLAHLSPADLEWTEKMMAELSGDAETTAQAIREAGGEATPFFGDISDFQVAADLVETAVKTYGSVDIVVNIAGTFGFSPVDKITPELWDHVNNTKPKGHFNVIRHAVPYMKEKRWGRIVNTTSRAFLGDVIRHAEYCAANAGVVGLTRAVAMELYRYNITCNAISPFAYTRASVELEAHERAFRGTEESIFLDPKFNFPIEITPKPEYLAPFIAYLCTDKAANISGAIFSVAGNRISVFTNPEPVNEIKKEGKEKWTLEELDKQVHSVLMKDYKSVVEF
ncbi:MAG: SDR family oxidoreductase [Firmicutes bacterium]|jgi:3-oxoacyl-[acyl-carrier protein] reductase|nr:SDR family oxidoreductase [Bacillota bacterium]